MDQLDFRYKDLREQLYTLGFHQQLPIGSMSIVSALLEDLIKVTDSYKQSKETVKNLLEEKRAWDLGIEPYKCDNSRLLSENNALHLEVIKVRGHYENKLLDLKHTIRNLEVDKNYLDDHCFELVSKISDMEQRGKSSKGMDDGRAMHKAPFVSTVRSGNIPQLFSSTSKHQPHRRCEGKSSANEHYIQTIKLQNDNQLLTDETNSLKKQLESRDNEIARLHKQLTGGRPVAALGRDCCYRGIDTLTEDMKLLQQQLISTKKELSESLEQQHEAKLRAIKLDEEKTKYAKDLKEMEDFALKFQDEANAKLTENQTKYEHLVDQLNESLHKIASLEAGGRSSSSTSQQTKIVENMKAALKKANVENDNLIERLVDNEQKFTEESKILARKNSKLEEKVQLLQSKMAREKPQSQLKHKATMTESQFDSGVSKEKILLQTEYLRRLNQPAYERELENVQAQLALREIEVDNLKEQLCQQQQSKTVSCTHTSISVQSVMSRMEREATTLKSKIDSMTSEREQLKQNLKEVLDELHNEQLSYAEQIMELTDRMKKLENDNRFLRDSQLAGTSNESKVLRMKEKSEEYVRQLEALDLENRKLKNSCTQIRTLQEQTERSLIDYQNRLLQAENNLAQTASEQGAMDAKLIFTNQTIANLKEEAVKLRSIIAVLEKDRNEMHNQLDAKTEQLIHLDTEMSKLRSDNAELNSKSLALQRQMSSKSHENVEKTSTIQKVTQETEILRKQIEHFKGLNENLTSENSRLSLEINDLTCACQELKRKQGMSDAEVNRLIDSIQDYVFKIKEVEDMLSSKKTECDRMRDHFNVFESGSKELERTNHSLEMENEEASRRLTEADREIQHLQEILNERDNEISANNRQITELGSQLTDVERDLKRREEELKLQQANSDAIRELCNKLDIEKEKLKEELNECSNIRRKLEQENEKLRKDLASNEALDQQGAVQKLQELLAASKSELEQQRATLSEKSTEIQKLRSKLNEISEKYEEEQSNCKRYQGLAQENAVQIQELNHKLTNYRYETKVTKEQMQKDEYDRNKILFEQIPSGGQAKFLDSISTNSDNSAKSKNSKSNTRTTEPPIALYRRTPLSAIKPSTTNGNKNISHLDYSESSEEINSTINSYVSKAQQVRPKKNGKIEKLNRVTVTSSIENIVRTSRRMSSANEFIDPRRTSCNQKMNRRDEPAAYEVKSINPSSVPVQLEMNDTTRTLPTQEDSVPLTNQATINSESREYTTCDSSSTVPHVRYQDSRKTSMKQSNFDASFLPPPPPVTETVVGYRSNRRATFNIQMDSYMGPIEAFTGNYVINAINQL